MFISEPTPLAAPTHLAPAALRLLTRQITCFTDENAFTWLPDKTFVSTFAPDKGLAFLTFQNPKNGDFRGGFAFGRIAPESGALVDALFNPEFVSDATFAHFAEFFGFDQAFTTQQFRVFPARL